MSVQRNKFVTAGYLILTCFVIGSISSFIFFVTNFTELFSGSILTLKNNYADSEIFLVIVCVGGVIYSMLDKKSKREFPFHSEFTVVLLLLLFILTFTGFLKYIISTGVFVIVFFMMLKDIKKLKKKKVENGSKQQQ